MSLFESTQNKVIGAVGIGAAAYYLWNQYNSSSSSHDDSSSRRGGIELPLPLRDTRNNPILSIEMLTNKQTLNHLDADGKRVLMRVDYNVKVKKGVVGDRTRIEGTIPTLKTLLSMKGPKGGVKCIVLITHLGRPAGNYDVKEFSLEPVAKVLQTYIPDNPVRFLPACIGPAVEEAINNCTPGTVFLLENLRFHMEETGVKIVENGGKLEKVKATFQQKVAFREALSRLGDCFVFEAFGAAHRPHASIVGINLPQRVSGHLMSKEMAYYAQVLGKPQRPFLAILGGAKVSDKILVIENLLNLVDEMIIGGGMAYTFKKVLEGVNIGSSLYDSEGAEIVQRIVNTAKARGVTLHFPVDHIIADKFSSDAKVGVTDDKIGIPNGWMALDVGPVTRTNNSVVMQRAATILWNGPLGVYEMGPFGGGTISAMWDIVKATQRGATTIIGGGDTGAASKHFFVGDRTVADQVSWVSTGGGSSLVLMEGKLLPAVGTMSNIGDYSLLPPWDESKEPEDDEDD